MLIKANLSSSDITILSVISIIQDKLLYCT